MSDTRHHTPRVRLRAGATATATLVLMLAGYSSAAATSSVASATTVPAATGQILVPSDVASIVASDTAINNRANGSLSLPLQDSHESCLEQILDDSTYRGEQAAGSDSLGGPFDQVPSRVFVPHEDSYPAFFSVLVKDRSSSQPTTVDLLTYVKTTSSAKWKLALSSEMLGPTNAGVAVPTAANDAEGYVTSLDPAKTDGLLTAPDKVAAEVASAFTSEARSGKLPPGISAQFGPNNTGDPHAIAASYSGIGTVTTDFTATTPTIATAGATSPDCPYPAIRLADGGALVTFAIYSQIVVHVRTGDVVVQPSDRSALGALLAPGSYSSVTMLAGDMGVAIVPPLGSHSPIEVIGQASESLSETGVAGSGSASSGASGGPADASSIARGVDPRLVDINTILNYQSEKAAGTGMVLTSKGEVLTNNHVIEGTTSISVTDIGNGKTYSAKVVGYSRSSDVAVLQLENASGLQAVSVGNSSNVNTGEGVVGIGNAGGTGGTPSFAGGSVTALKQAISASDDSDGTSEQLTGLIETNAGIEPGDSGGPLVDGKGSVIGMDTAASGGFSFQQGGSLTTQSFAIPIDTALKIASEITAGHSSSTVHVGPTAFLGVELFSSGRSGFGGFGRTVPTPTSSGAAVESVVSGSPASRAGLVGGDTITSLDNQTVSSPASLTTIIASKQPGASLSVGYVNPSGAKQKVTVHLTSGPPE